MLKNNRDGIKIFHIDLDYVTIKFLLVGVINTLFGTTIMFVCYNIFHMSYWWSSAANYFFGSILSFLLNKYFTFKTQYKSIQEVFRFIVNICLCYFVAYGIAKPISYYLLKDASVSVRENVAMIIGMIIFVGLNYIGQRYFVFTHKETRA